MRPKITEGSTGKLREADLRRVAQGVLVVEHCVTLRGHSAPAVGSSH